MSDKYLLSSLKFMVRFKDDSNNFSDKDHYYAVGKKLWELMQEALKRDIVRLRERQYTTKHDTVIDEDVQRNMCYVLNI